jgi:hypothetical protein
MRRIILAVTTVAVILGIWAAAAFAGCVSGAAICAPAADRAPGNGASNNNAPDAEQRTDAPPENDGTAKAREHSPAFCE